MHDAIISLDPDRNDIRTDAGLENQAGNPPFEVAHGFVCPLVDFAFGEDMDPAVAARGVRRRGREGVEAVGGVG